MWRWTVLCIIAILLIHPVLVDLAVSGPELPSMSVRSDLRITRGKDWAPDRPMVLDRDLSDATDEGRITGRVVDIDGRGIQGAKVVLETGRTDITDQDGSFIIDGVEGSYELLVTAEGYSSVRRPVVIKRDFMNDIGAIQLTREGDDDGGARAGWTLYLVLAIGSLSIIGSVLYLIHLLRKERWED